MTDAEVKKMILTKLMFVPSISYSELHKVTGNHDLFNYHLRELATKGLVEKSDSSYSLSAKGRQQVALMEEDGEYQKQFKVGMFIDVIRKQNDKWQMLLYRRLKHPHYGYSGAVTGKLKWGDTLRFNLERELNEELGIIPKKFDQLGIHRQIFLNEQGEKVGDGVFFVFVVTEWEGTPLERGIEGEYYWQDIDSILSLDKIFRKGFQLGLPHVQAYLNDPEHFVPYMVEEGEDKLGY